MKNALFILIASISLILTSCKKEDIQPQPPYNGNMNFVGTFVWTDTTFNLTDTITVSFIQFVDTLPSNIAFTENDIDTLNISSYDFTNTASYNVSRGNVTFYDRNYRNERDSSISFFISPTQINTYYLDSDNNFVIESYVTINNFRYTWVYHRQ